MTDPVESFVDLPAGRFRTLQWGTTGETVLFLHGLTGVAEVWGPLVAHLDTTRCYVALDQRGHGQSPSAPSLDYSSGAFVQDTLALVRGLGGRVHLVGHSMGARVALIMAARHPEVLRSTAIIDIGPEASRANIASTLQGLASRPQRFASRQAALAFAFRNRTPAPADEAIFLARLMPDPAGPKGSLAWRSPAESLGACVSRQRARNYWKEWRSILPPALFVHGGTSSEVSTRIADTMCAANPSVEFRRLEGVGHNVPLIAPERLAGILQDFWRSVGSGETY